MTIRPLRRDDISPLVGVLSRAYGSEQNFDRLQSYLQTCAIATFVAENDGRAVGMVVGNDYGPLAYISQMAVDPPLQRRSIATRLMDALITWADAGGFSTTELDATAAGEPLYRRYGFLESDRTIVYSAGPADDSAPLHAGRSGWAPGNRFPRFRG